MDGPHQMRSRHARAGHSTPRDILLAAIIGGAQFIQMLDSTVMINALPSIARSLGHNAVSLNLAITAYLVCSAIFLPVGTWVADRFGTLTVFRSAIGCFAIASIICGMAESLTTLVVARAFQGAAGAMMLPVGRLILLKSVPKDRLVEALAVQQMPALLGPLVGLLVGGLIITYASWRLIFFINLPIALLGIVLATRYIPNIKDEHRSPFDWGSFLLSAVVLGAVTLALDGLGPRLLSLPIALSLLALGAGILIILVVRLCRAKAGLLDLSLFRLRTFRSAMTGGLLSRAQNGAAPFLLVLLLQSSFGLTPLHASLIICASAIGALTMRSGAPWLLRRFGFRTVLIASTVLTSGTFVAYALCAVASSLYGITLALLIGGFVRALQFTALNGLAYSEVSPAKHSHATALAATLQQMAQAGGVGMCAIILQVSASSAGHGGFTSRDIATALLFLGAITGSAIFFFVGLRRDAGDKMIPSRVRLPGSEGEEIL